MKNGIQLSVTKGTIVLLIGSFIGFDIEIFMSRYGSEEDNTDGLNSVLKMKNIIEPD